MMLSRALGRVCTARRSLVTHRAARVYAAAFTQPQTRRTELQEARRVMEMQAKPLHFNVAGVSFEGRQEAVQQVKPGQSLLLLPDPSNEHDPHAVQVTTLSGTQLGFVPRTHNQQFSDGPTVARVVGAGAVQNPQGAPGPLYGISVLAELGLMYVLPLPIPKAAAAAAEEKVVQAADDKDLQEQVWHQAGGACEVSGIAAAEGMELELVPVWQVDRQARTVSVLRYAAVCAEVAQARQLLQLPPGSPDAQQARLTMRMMNQWSEANVDQYLQWAQQLQAEMDSDSSWQVLV